MDMEILLKALENENNKKIMNLTSKKLNQMKMEILKELELSNDILLDYMKKLKNYRYVDELDDIDNGRFIRWIKITEPENIFLSSGAIVCEIKIMDNGMYILCKNFAKKHYQLKMDEYLIFQKLTTQEEVLLTAMNHLSK